MRFKLSRRSVFAFLGGLSTPKAWPGEHARDRAVGTLEPGSRLLPAETQRGGDGAPGEATRYPQSAAERRAKVIPADYRLDPAALDPRRYGAVGDGLLDDSEALQMWVAVVNSSENPVSAWPMGLTFVSGPLPTITSANFTWHCWSTLKSKSGSISGSQCWLTISGIRLRIYGMTLNGDQASHTVAAGNAMLYLNAVTDVLLDGCSFANGWMKGAVFFEVDGAFITNCHFDGNANLGLELIAARHMKFINCTMNSNGFGFQRTFVLNGFAAFGAALRLRTHHITFIACEAKQNGRDGFCTNQGSYAAKYIGCLAWMNGDGGFTLAADDSGSGLRGEAEACYDCEYIDCESYNNWSSGLAAYAPAHNVTIKGGRFYNNNRVAGVQVLASAYFSGLYFTAGSSAICVDTKAYDDRQLCDIQAVNLGELKVIDWVHGNMETYPRVAFYDATLAFKGYGSIEHEATGLLAVSATAHDGVDISEISPGWFVTQRVQHNGVFFDNGVQGSIHVDGFGMLRGPAEYSGYHSISGYLANNQNVLLPAASLDPVELLKNPSWDTSIQDWEFSMGNGSARHFTETGTYARSSGALQMTGGSVTGIGDGVLIADGIRYAQNCYLEAAVWCHSVGRGDATLFIYWHTRDVPLFSNVTHPGGGWKQLKIGIFAPPNNNQLIFRIAVNARKTAYFDNAILRVKADKTDNRDFEYSSRKLPI